MKFLNTPGPWSKLWIRAALRHISKHADWDSLGIEEDEMVDVDTPNYNNNQDINLISQAPEMDLMLKLIMLGYVKFDTNTEELRFNGLRYTFSTDTPNWDDIVRLIGGYENLKKMVENKSGKVLD